MTTTLPVHRVREESPNPATVALCSELGRVPRSEPRATLNELLWITSLHKPGVFEIVPIENASRTGIQLVTQRFWEPGEVVLVSSPPGLCQQGSVVYCRKLPSDEHVLGIRLHPPVEHWIQIFGLATP